MAETPQHITKKSTIVKARVGCVKTSTYDLPHANHVYGKPHEEDEVGVADSK